MDPYASLPSTYLIILYRQPSRKETRFNYNPIYPRNYKKSEIKDLRVSE